MADEEQDPDVILLNQIVAEIAGLTPEGVLERIDITTEALASMVSRFQHQMTLEVASSIITRDISRAMNSVGVGVLIGFAIGSEFTKTKTLEL